MSKIFKILAMAIIISQPAVCFGESVYALSFYKPSVATPYDYKGKDISRDGLSAMFGIEGINEYGFGGSIFAGVGALGSDIGEFILGVDLKKSFWLWEERIAIPISLGFAWRIQFAYIENNLVAMFIDEPKFSQELKEHLDEKRSMDRNNFDMMPSIDLQFFISESFSLYIGYMYRINFAGDWKVTESSDDFTVPEVLNPLENSKEQFFGIPGTLRFGVKIHLKEASHEN